MAGAAIILEWQGLDKAVTALDRVADLQPVELLDVAGGVIESQTRRRIADEKTSPGGEEWPEWSIVTAGTRHSGHSLLVGELDLIDSIQYIVGGNEVEIGSPLVYAAIHNFGGEAGRGGSTEIPAREYLGLSDDNSQELEEVFTDLIEGALQ